MPRADAGERGSARRAASASPPTPCNLRYHVLLTPALSTHSIPCCKRDGKRGRSQEGGRPDPAAEAADLGGLRKPPQLQPVLVATRPVRAGVPSLVHSLRRALDRPVPPRLGGADLTHVPHPHMAVGSSRRRSRRPLGARHSLKDGLPDLELVSAATGARDGPEGAKHTRSKAK